MNVFQTYESFGNHSVNRSLETVLSLLFVLGLIQFTCPFNQSLKGQCISFLCTVTKHHKISTLKRRKVVFYISWWSKISQQVTLPSGGPQSKSVSLPLLASFYSYLIPQLLIPTPVSESGVRNSTLLIIYYWFSQSGKILEDSQGWFRLLKYSKKILSPLITCLGFQVLQQYKLYQLPIYLHGRKNLLEIFRIR